VLLRWFSRRPSCGGIALALNPTGLAAARAEMHVGNEKRAKPSRVDHDAASFLQLIMAMRIASSRLGFMTAPLTTWRPLGGGVLRLAAPEPHQHVDAERRLSCQVRFVPISDFDRWPTRVEKE